MSKLWLDIRSNTKHLRVFFFLQMLMLYWSFKVFIVLTIVGIVVFFTDISLSRLKKMNRIHAALIMLYVCYVASLLWTDNLSMGLSDIETKFSLLFFPLFFVVTNVGKYSELIIKNFVFASVVSSVILLCRALYHFFVYGYFLFYTEYSFILHPSYLSMYLLVAWIFLMSMSDIDAKLKWLGSMMLGLSVFFSSSKAGIFLLLLLLMAFVFLKFKFIYRIIAICLICLSVIALYDYGKRYFSPVIDRFITQFEITGQILSPHEERIRLETNSIRYYAWKSSIRAIEKNFWLGVGCGDVHQCLNEEYVSENLQELADKNINSHNQFLNTFIAAGFIGFMILCAIFFELIYLAYRKKNTMVFFVAWVFVFNFMFESMIETEAGSIFMSYIISIIATFTYKSNEL